MGRAGPRRRAAGTGRSGSRRRTGSWTLRTPDGPLRARIDPEGQVRPIPSVSRVKPARRPSPVRRFVRAWGWRAYALPLLVVLSVLCGIDVANGAEAGMPLLGSGPEQRRGGRRHRPGHRRPRPRPAAPTEKPKPTPTGIYVDDGGAGTARPLPPTALPAGGRVHVQRGSGRYDVVPGTSPRSTAAGPLHRFTVELEAGVADDGPAFAAAVEKTLSDPHSWSNGGTGVVPAGGQPARSTSGSA